MSLNIARKDKDTLKCEIFFIIHLLVMQSSFKEQIQQIAEDVQYCTNYNCYGI